ncbi:MAG: flagellin FliC [Magnetococcales bacterium]|nr:flagellin FliC [Magnetococcales bacterium]
MSMVINTNMSALNAQRNLAKTTNSLSTTYERLTSGLRVNSAKDDAAGLSISSRMTAQVRGINQSVRNANDAISMLQVAEGALDETTNALQRIRELAVQASNESYTTSDRDSLQLEVNQLLSEIERIKADSTFNKMNLLDGTVTGKHMQVGAFSGQYVSVTVGSAGRSGLGVDLLVVSGTTFAKANSAITLVDAALNSVADIRSNIGAMQNRFESIIANLSVMSERTTGARSAIMDADVAEETANLAKHSILQQAGTAILAQANQQPQLALSLLSSFR